jgi:hypothetical protein
MDVRGSEDTHALAPSLSLGVDNDLVGERVRVSRCDGWNMVFVSIDDIDDLERGFVEGHFHRAADFDNVYKDVCQCPNS